MNSNNTITTDEAAQKGIFLFLYCIFGTVVILITHFVVMYKGWGLSVQSWPWMIFLWLSAAIVTCVKDKLIKLIKEV